MDDERAGPGGAETTGVVRRAPAWLSVDPVLDRPSGGVDDLRALGMQLDVVLPLGGPPEGLAEQRTWA